MLGAPVTCFDINNNGDLIVFGIGSDWCLGINGISTQKTQINIGCKIISPGELYFMDN